MEQEELLPTKSKKVTVRVLAAGFSVASALLQFSYFQKSLDVVYYGHRIDIYTPINIICILGALTTGVFTGGTYLVSNMKNNGRN